MGSTSNNNIDKQDDFLRNEAEPTADRLAGQDQAKVEEKVPQRDGPTHVTVQIDNSDTIETLQDDLEPARVTGQPIQLSDFVGEHGTYQLSLTLILFIRYVFLGLMANSGPLLTPDVTFYCRLPRAEVLAIMPNISTLSEREQELEIKEEFKQICQIDLHLYQNQTNLFAFNSSKAFKAPAPSLVKAPANFTRPDALQFQSAFYETSTDDDEHKTMTVHYSISSGPSLLKSMPRIRECTDFDYELALDQGRTMTSEFDLVCERDWLRSLFQSLLSAAIVVAHVFWGTFSDKYGRYQAQRLCLVVSLVAGGWSIFALDFWSFTLARALCSFGDLGLVVSMTTTVVELVGNHYRGLSVALVNFGFALGVTLLPYIVAYFEDFRLVVAFTLLCHVVTMPFIWLTTNESIRWLLTNRKFSAARKELKRITRWNRRMSRNLAGFKQFLSASTDKVDPSGRLQQKKTTTKRQRHEQKRAFESLFRAFVEQIESQNLCDPLNVVKDEHQVPGGQPEQQLMSPAINVIDCSGQQSPADKDHQQVSTILTPVSHAREHANSNNSILNNDTKTGMPVGWRSPSKSGAQNRSPASWCLRDDLTAAPNFLARTVSCTQLTCVAPSEDIEFRPGADLGRRLFDRQQEDPNKLKRLTLPIVADTSRATSIFGDSDDDEANDYPLKVWSPNEIKPQPDCINLVAHQLSFVGRVSRLFRDKKLMIAVFTIVWTTFNSELQYTSFIIINLEVGEDVYLNYILGGCMEALAAISASLLLSYAPRRQSLITFWLLISLSCFGLSVAHIDSTWAVWLLALAKFSQSCLSSIASVAAYESFPTFLRQSGSGLVFTLGMLGSVFAPLIFAEFDDHAGMDRVLMTFSVSSLTAATLIYLFLNETRDCELQ